MQIKQQKEIKSYGYGNQWIKSWNKVGMNKLILKKFQGKKYNT